MRGLLADQRSLEETGAAFGMQRSASFRERQGADLGRKIEIPPVSAAMRAFLDPQSRVDASCKDNWKGRGGSDGDGWRAFRQTAGPARRIYRRASERWSNRRR
ncbi:protein of unknown function [Methylocella tundrae]|uniref:Uncharacterized protein n=1 Tax=Methylocella tundrae TaxID=227605 RepID=A0A4U8Z3Q0_METTU|nr:protein of unknown function [Methylocella tundrae]